MLTKEQRDELLVKASKNDVFKLAVKSAFNHIIVTDIEGIIIFANSSVERITGYSQEEIIGSTPRLWGGQMDPEFYKNMWHVIKEEQRPYLGEITNRRKTGELYTAKTIVSPIFDDQKTLIGFIGTEEDITKQKEVDRMKTEFVSITAHQLKTPMTVIKWNLELLSNKIATNLDDKDKEYLASITKSNQDLINLVDALLNISRIESGRLSINPQQINISEVIDSAIKRLELLKISKGINIKVNLESQQEIVADRELVYQILTNLINNAIKYSPDKSTVEISVAKDNEDMIIAVKDNGIGIPEAEQKKIFEKHFRSSNVKAKEIDGTGLGLYFVKLIVNSYSGKVWFESKENQGSTFYFTIPLKGMQSREGEIGLG